jgi:hypothetical protein
MKAGATASAHTAMIEVVDHDVPTDPVKLRKLRLAQANAAIRSAERAIKKLEGFIEHAPHGKKGIEREHLAVAKQALAEAIAHKEGITDGLEQ